MFEIPNNIPETLEYLEQWRSSLLNRILQGKPSVDFSASCDYKMGRSPLLYQKQCLPCQLMTRLFRLEQYEYGVAWTLPESKTIRLIRTPQKQISPSQARGSQAQSPFVQKQPGYYYVDPFTSRVDNQILFEKQYPNESANLLYATRCNGHNFELIEVYDSKLTLEDLIKALELLQTLGNTLILRQFQWNIGGKLSLCNSLYFGADVIVCDLPEVPKHEICKIVNLSGANWLNLERLNQVSLGPIYQLERNIYKTLIKYPRLVPQKIMDKYILNNFGQTYIMVGLTEPLLQDLHNLVTEPENSG